MEEGVSTGTEEDEMGSPKVGVRMGSLLVVVTDGPWALTRVKECDARRAREKNVRMRAADAEQQRMIGFGDVF